MRLRALAIGSGWGAHAARVFAADERVDLAGIVGRGSPRTTALAASLGVPHFTDLAAAIDAVRPEVASVAAHESVNYGLVKQLLEGGAHVLCSHPVAPSRQEVLDLERMARERGRIVATDYSLRVCEAYLAAKKELTNCGALLKAIAETPSRTFVIGIDLLADALGPIDKVLATTRYPPSLRARRSQSPKAFAPTVLFEHASGTVSTIVPVPHTAPSASYRLTLSTENATVRVQLPGGGAVRFQYLGRGAFREAELAPVHRESAPTRAFALPMEGLVRRFLESALRGVDVDATFAQEAHTRAVWSAIDRSIHERRFIDVDRS